MLIQSLGVFERVFPDGMTTGRSLIISVVGFIIVFSVLGVIALFVKGMGAFFDAKNKNAKSEDTTETGTTVAEASQIPATAQNGPVLEGVTEPEAAVIMALVSHESGIPLIRLQFNSIKFTEEVK